MLNRRHLLTGFALTLAIPLTIAAVAPVAALDKAPFDAKAFEDAQAAGKAILVEVTAPWCPTCRAQAPILARLSGTPKFKDMVRFNIDFDSQKDLLRRFNVRMQSTMIAFKGKQEVGRSTGDTNPNSIERLLEKSI
jgi:thioredoxin 1